MKDYRAELTKAGKKHAKARADLEALELWRDKLIRQAHRDGKLSTREIAPLVGMSHQRVGQIVKD